MSSAKKPNCSKNEKKGYWLWQCSIDLKTGSNTEFPICPFCSYLVLSSKRKQIPSRCPNCKADLKIQKKNK